MCILEKAEGRLGNSYICNFILDKTPFGFKLNFLHCVMVITLVINCCDNHSFDKVYVMSIFHY
jgi:hypothetical protein